MEDRHLNFNSFINDRANQIAKFSEALELDTKKKGHQALPKSVRRRAMSHNKYRIPLKIRRPMQESLAKAESMQKLPKCRKSIRKKHRLLLSYKLRSSKYKWLPTHLWSAKRMRMINYFGYKIAYTPNDKCYRSAYRYFRHNTCLVDLSYYRCLTIKLNPGKIPEFIKIKSNKNIHKYIQQYEQLLGSELYYGELFEQSLICPLLILVHTQKQQINCFFDPCCNQQIQNYLRVCLQQNYEYKITGSPCQVYCLLGPTALQRVKQSLKDEIRNQKMQQKLQAQLFHPLYEKKNKLQYYYPQIGQQSATNNFLKSPIGSSPLNVPVKTGYDPNTNSKSRSTILQIFNSYRSLSSKSNTQTFKNDSGVFWDFYNAQAQKNEEQVQSQNLFIRVTTRSKYTHKRANKLTKQEKKQILIADEQNKNNMISEQIKIEKIQGAQNIETIRDSKKHQQFEIIAEKRLEQQGEVKRINTSQVSELDPFAIGVINSQTSDMFIGCYLFCNSNNNCKIWRNLTRKNLKVIGQRQYKHCLLESGLRSFPEDYHETKSYLNHCKQKSISLICKYQRLPYQKRTNYAKINSPYPFITELSLAPQRSLRNVQQVNVSMVSRGRCFSGSYICKLENEDFQTVEDYLLAGSIKHIFKQQYKQISTNKIDYKNSCDHINKQLVKKSRENMGRKIIGFITTGGFLYSTCKQGGIGFIYQNVLSQKIQNELKQQNKYILIRKPTSKYYFLGVLV